MLPPIEALKVSSNLAFPLDPYVKQNKTKQKSKSELLEKGRTALESCLPYVCTEQVKAVELFMPGILAFPVFLPSHLL